LETLNFLSWTVFSFILVLGIMIFVHELGHHLMAKFLKIRVDVFSLGFGPRLFGFKKGETDYRVSLLPLGGFVKMAGEHYGDELTGSPDEFLSRPKKHRFAVAIAGPAMNVLLAIVLLTISYMVGIQVPAYLSEAPVIGHVVEDSPAADAGLAAGDLVLSVDSKPTPTWEEFQLSVLTAPGQELPIIVRREEEEFRRIVQVREEEGSGAGFIGVLPPIVTIITSVEEGPAARAGLRAGDEIQNVVVDGNSATELNQILELISSHEGVPVDFTVLRGEESFVTSVTPERIEDRVRVGIAISQAPKVEAKLERFGPIEALKRSIQRNYQMSALTLQIVGKLVTGQTSLKMMSGPIEIAKFSGQAASQGFLALTGFMALISLQLGIFNLLPVPILDGGVIALLAVEGIMGRDISLRVKERIFQLGFIFLVLLMSIVILNDISKNV
jgi:regulator of sigma E protease